MSDRRGFRRRSALVGAQSLGERLLERHRLARVPGGLGSQRVKSGARRRQVSSVHGAIGLRVAAANSLV